MSDGAEYPGDPGPGSDEVVQLRLERYKYILQQMNQVNESIMNMRTYEPVELPPGWLCPSDWDVGPPFNGDRREA